MATGKSLLIGCDVSFFCHSGAKDFTLINIDNKNDLPYENWISWSRVEKWMLIATKKALAFWTFSQIYRFLSILILTSLETNFFCWIFKDLYSIFQRNSHYFIENLKIFHLRVKIFDLQNSWNGILWKGLLLALHFWLSHTPKKSWIQNKMYFSWPFSSWQGISIGTEHILKIGCYNIRLSWLDFQIPDLQHYP